MRSDDHVPHWLTDEEAIAPCPCGHPMIGQVAVIRGETGLRTGFHFPDCMHLMPIYTDSDDSDIDWMEDDE